MKYILFLLLVSYSKIVSAQEISGSEQFWTKLKSHCGKAYEGELITGGNDDFAGKKLVMHVRTCEDDTVRIPFFVGEDKSRDRKSTRLNSSHVKISYAVFCLKKKKINN